MQDLEIRLEDRPGALAEMGEALGKAGISIEGGGGFTVDRGGLMHFLFSDANAARSALEAANICVVRARAVVSLRLRQAEPGQLGKIARRMAEAGVNIEVVYSDHDGQLIVVPDDVAQATTVRDAWIEESHENAQL